MDKKYLIPLIIVVAIIALIVALVSSSLKKLKSDEVGLMYDTIQKKLGDSAQREGLHNGPPGFEFIIFPSVYKTISFGKLECLNKDGVQIDLNVAYQYQARTNKLNEIVTQFRDHDGYVKVLKAAGQSALHEACSQYNTSQFQAERGVFQESVRTIMTARYNVLHADVTDLQVSNIQRPSAYERAIKAKEAARENIKVAENERPRKTTQARTTLRESETQAIITIEKAQSNARIAENKATTEAEAILNTYAREAETYKKLISSEGLGLTTEGFLSYIGVRAIASAQNPVYVGMKGPAKTAYP